MSTMLICFDLDGLYFTSESFQKFKALLAPNIEKSQRDFVLATSDQMMQFKAGKLSETEYRNWAQKQLNLTFTIQEIYSKFHQSYETNPDVVQLADDLKKKGYKIGICSNNFPTRIHALDQKFNFLSKFDVRIFSYEVGVLKPSSEIFQILIDQSGLNPHNIIYSDDKEDKLQGAKSLGIQTFVFHNFQEFLQDLQNCGVNVS